MFVCIYDKNNMAENYRTPAAGRFLLYNDVWLSVKDVILSFHWSVLPGMFHLSECTTTLTILRISVISGIQLCFDFFTQLQKQQRFHII